MTVLITMAGFGTRFQQAGYGLPKYAIEVKGRTLFEWSILSLQKIAMDSDYVFVVRAEDNAGAFINLKCREIGLKTYRIVELDNPTDGQATTAYLGLKACDDNAPVLIYNIDTYVEPEYVLPPEPHFDGYIPCFKAPGSHWSFVGLDAFGRVVGVREKVRISDLATIGLYWFKTKKLYVDAYTSWYASTSNYEGNEAYIAPLYNYLCESGLCVGISEIPCERVHPLGTPEEVMKFVSS